MAPAISGLPEGYTLEDQHQPTTQAQVSGLPEGYTLEQPNSTPSVTDKQAAYRKAVAAGPYTQPGAAEKAMGAEWGDNAAQLKEGLKNLGEAAVATAGGVAGAQALDAVSGPVLTAIGAHLDTIKRIMGMAKRAGIDGLTYEGAKALYREFTSDKK